MRYINQLIEQRNRLLASAHVTESQINNFIAHLHSPKFQGTESDGERKDWIATGDVLQFLIQLRNEIHTD